MEVALDSRYRAAGSNRGRPATLIDLSASGASFVIEEALKAGSRIDHLAFTLGEEPRTHTFGPAAEVIRCDPREGIGRGSVYRVSVRFRELEEVEQGLLNEFVCEALARQGDAYDPRIEVEEPVSIRFTRFEEFVHQVSKNLSKTGMFIESSNPSPPGTRLDFVIQLGDDFNMAQGSAEVVWRREITETAPDRPSGMGVRFLALDRTSESVLRRLISSHIEPSYPRAVGTPRKAETGTLDLPDLLDEPEDLSLS